jgi:thiol-disulfide isomerase/thioredoxin
MEKSRYVLFAIAAITAGLGGVFFSGKPDKQPVAAQSAVIPSQATPAQASSDLVQTLASGKLKQPDGQAFSWKLPPSAKPAEPVAVVNFWATWCGPCVEEMPELDRLSKALAPNSVVGVAIDNPTNVREFLQKTPVTYPIALAGLEGTDLMRALGNTGGGLPFTVLLDAKGKVVFSKMGKTNEAELKQQLVNVANAAK